MKIMNQLQKSGMKFLTDKKKILLTTLFFITANSFVFAQDQNIIPSNGSVSYTHLTLPTILRV